MSKPCTFVADQDSCQATDIERCTYCGSQSKTACGKATADRSVVSAYRHGNLRSDQNAHAEQLISEGVKAWWEQ